MNKPALTPEQRAILARRIAAGRAARGDDRIPRREPGVRVPLSATQRSLWLVAQINPGTIAYNQQLAFHAAGPFDDHAFAAAFTELFARHESLRSVVSVDDSGMPFARLLAADSIAPELVVDACGATEADARVREVARRPFDLETDLPLRALVLHHGSAQHTVALLGHHIALDNLSGVVLYRELLALYAARVDGADAGLAEPKLQFGDYAIWQAARLAGTRGDELAQFWTEQLRGLPAALDLPCDRARPRHQEFEGGRVAVAVDAATLTTVNAAARAAGVTAFMYLFTAFAVLVYRWSGQADFAVGTPIGGRDRLELEELVGFVNNTLAIPVHLAGNPSWRRALAATKATMVDAFAHAELPFERVVEALNPPRDPSRNPVFQVNFRVAPTSQQVVEAGGLRCERYTLDLGYSKFDLALELHLGDDGIGGHVEYNASLFTPATAVAFAQAYRDTLHAVAADADVPIVALPSPTTTHATPAVTIRRRPRA